MRWTKALEIKIRLAFMASLVALIVGGAFYQADATGMTIGPEASPVVAFWQEAGLDETADQIGDELQDPTPLENWQIILAFAMPGIVEFFRKLDWTDRQKMAASFLITAVVTTLTLFLQGDLDLSLDYLTTVLKVFALTIPAYYGMWKPLGLAGQTGKTYGVQ